MDLKEKTMKRILLFLPALLIIQTAFSQSGSLLGKYRNMALEYNHNLKAAEKNITISLELQKSAKADRLPQLGAGANFQYTGNPAELHLNLPSMNKTVHIEGSDMKYGASLTLAQPVYTGRRIIETIRRSELQQSMAMNQSQLVRTAVCYQTDIQYWNTVTRQEVVRITNDFCKSVATLVTTIRERVEAGLTDPQDLLMAEVKLNEAKFQLLQAQSNFITGRMAFNSLLGLSLDEPTPLDAVLPTPNLTDTLLLQDGSSRPELHIARDQISLAESNLRLNDSQYKPQLYVGIDGNYSSPGYNFKTDMDFNYAAYAKLSVPLFEWGKRRSDKRASAEQIGIASDRLNQTTDEVNLEIKTAKIALEQALEQVTLTENSLEKAEENEQKALERYNEGKTSIVEVIDAQTYRQNSQLNYIQAKAAAQYRYSDLLKSVNGY